MLSPMDYEKYTEFYILDQNGETNDYPQKLQEGDSGKVIIGIINRELVTTRYSIELKIDRKLNTYISDFILENDEKIEEIISFTPDTVGDNQKVEFLLYKKGANEPCNSLHLWVTVTGKE